jgi:hypothetical protein
VTDADFNVTYNYSEVTKIFDWSFGDLNGKTAEETLPMLREIVQKSGTRKWRTPLPRSLRVNPAAAFPAEDEYEWHPYTPTPGNCGYAANVLLTWGQLHPDAVWEVT